MEKQAEQNQLSGYLNSKNNKYILVYNYIEEIAKRNHWLTKSKEDLYVQLGKGLRNGSQRIKNLVCTFLVVFCVIKIVFAFVVLPMYIEYENEQLRRFVKDNGITQSKLMQYEKRMHAAQSQPNVSIRRY